MLKPLARTACQARDGAASGAGLSAARARAPKEKGKSKKERDKSAPTRVAALTFSFFLLPFSFISSNPPFNRDRNSMLVIRRRHAPAVLLQLVAGVAHDNRNAGEFEHFHVVEVVADGHHLGRRAAAMPRPALHRGAFRAGAVEYVNDRKIALWILGPQHRDAALELGRRQPRLHPVHRRNRAAVHHLDAIARPALLDGRYVLDVVGVLLDPPGNAAVEAIERFQD